ncbi:hypothetical protein WJX74_001610 [Apatococcus lobatus]|uniref:Uncharacterized protein n=1 Tax=Apatococcus lobatus TaxID=904363 RepID=A0AAW1RD86_9CHLO
MPDGQQDGRKPWTVNNGDDIHKKLEDLGKKFSKLEADFYILKQTLVPAHIRDLAAQVQQNAVDHLHMKESDQSFQNLAKEQYQPLLNFAEQLGVRPALLAARLDLLIKRRNKTNHREILEDEVSTAQTLLDSQPDLRTSLRHETELLQNYDILQKCFAP